MTPILAAEHLGRVLSGEVPVTLVQDAPEMLRRQDRRHPIPRRIVTG